MTPDRFDQVIAVFNSILDHNAEDRPDMIDAIGRQGIDPDLCHEVEKLFQQSTATWEASVSIFVKSDGQCRSLNRGLPAASASRANDRPESTVERTINTC